MQFKLSQYLNKKEVKKILGIIKSQWSAEVELNYSFFISDKNKLYIMNKEIANYNLSGIRINSLGLYLGEYKNESLRLSIEGTQIIGPYANKNTIEINSEETKRWMSGEELIIENTCYGFVIIKNHGYYLGCGKCVSLSENQSKKRILNYVPKNRRLH